MFTTTPEGVFESSLLAGIPGVKHGFGTRAANGWPGVYTQVKQIHSDIVLAADDQEGCLGRGDALTTRVPGRWVGIRTADCVPILLADPHTRAVAAVHAGWRGTVAEIAQRAVEQMVRTYGSRPSNIVGAIGPCIGECCFEVGEDVAARFDALLPQRARNGYIDLVAENRGQLLTSGLLPDNIDIAGACTMCDPDRFHSYRRDREASGRMVAAISIG